MIDSLVIVLREGVEAALVVGIILAFLGRSAQSNLRKWVYWGLGLAILASIAVAGVFQAVGFDPENEYLEGALLGVGGIFVASMVIWVWRSARHLKTGMEKRLETMTSKNQGFQGWGLLLFTFFMVLREGVETVLFLYTVTLGEFQTIHLMGAILGIALAVLFAVFFVRGSLRVNLQRFFQVTGIVLLVLALRLLAGSVHEFSEVGLLPMSAGVMRALGYFVRDNTSALIMMALVAVPLIMVLWGARKPETVAPETDVMKRRQIKAEGRQGAVWRGALVVASFVVLLGMGKVAFASGSVYDPLPQPVTPAGDAVVLKAAQFEAGKLYKFSATLEGEETRFLVFRQEDGSLSTAKDACKICGPKGYMQEDAYLICKNCNAPIYAPTLGLGGGCDPLALPSSTTGDDLVIPVAGLR